MLFFSDRKDSKHIAYLSLILILGHIAGQTNSTSYTAAWYRSLQQKKNLMEVLVFCARDANLSEVYRTIMMVVDCDQRRYFVFKETSIW